MPITSSVEIVNTLSSLTFNANGTLDATFSVLIGGLPALDKSFHIDAINSSVILDSPVPQGFDTMREGVIVGVYQYLLTSGQLHGVMS